MIAMAIGCSPRLVIADEPTTALDVTVQARILALIDGLRAESKMAVLLVSHDLAVIAGHCDRVIVMYAGLIMESGPVEAVLREPKNPYTLALLEARPRPGAPRGARLKTIPGAPPAHARTARRLPVRRPMRADRRCLPDDAAARSRIRREPPVALSSRARSGARPMSEPPLLEVSTLVKTYRLPGVGPFSRKSARPALAGVSFSMPRGRSFGIVGESGSGKSTLGAHRARARPAGLRRGAARGALAVRFAAARIARVARAYADGLPGPLWFARSAPARRENRRRAAGGAGRSEQGRAPRARPSVARGGRPQSFGRFKVSA